MAGGIDGGRDSARGGRVPFMTSFGEALRVIPAGDDVAEGDTIFLRSCGRCGALVMCEGDPSGDDAAHRHNLWHAGLGQ